MLGTTSVYGWDTARVVVVIRDLSTHPYCGPSTQGIGEVLTLRQHEGLSDGLVSCLCSSPSRSLKEAESGKHLSTPVPLGAATYCPDLSATPARTPFDSDLRQEVKESRKDGTVRRRSHPQTGIGRPLPVCGTVSPTRGTNCTEVGGGFPVEFQTGRLSL